MKVLFSKTQLLHNPETQIHDGKKESYPEAPKRAEAILRRLDDDNRFEIIEPNKEPSSLELEKVCNPAYLDYLEQKSKSLKQGQILYPSNFIIDTYAPIDNGTFAAAMASAKSAYSGARLLLDSEQSVYSLCRPPGHHAGCNHSGGYCYVNNAALAANTLSKHGKVAILDIDYHHGNGTQDIFYERSDVLYVSLHANPKEKYPYFSGFANETGKGAGIGFNNNYPLSLDTDESGYLNALSSATNDIKSFGPAYLVVSIGFDTHTDDPVGGLNLSTDSYLKIGAKIAALNLPSSIIQEGGYNTGVLGESCRNFLGEFCQ